MTPPISILLTTYNRSSYLPSAIASILTQTYPHFELILWDDGCTDGSLNIAQSYARQDDHIRLIAPHCLSKDDRQPQHIHPEVGMVYTNY